MWVFHPVLPQGCQFLYVFLLLRSAICIELSCVREIPHEEHSQQREDSCLVNVEINVLCIIDPTFCKWNVISLLDLDMNLREALAQNSTQAKAAFRQIPRCDLDLWTCGEYMHLSLAHF